MHSLKSYTTVQSIAYPGVEFRIRTLNVVQRAKRDAGVAAHRLEYQRLTAERAEQFRALVGTEGTLEEQNAKANALPVAKRMSIIALDEQAEHILQQYLTPATIEAALAGISGYEIDGKEPTAKELIEHAPDDLLLEIYNACVYGSCLTEGEAKN